MENEKQIYDYAYKLITEENKSSEEVIKAIMAKGIEGKDASNIYYSAFDNAKRKEEEPMYKARAEALAQIRKYSLGRIFKRSSATQEDDFTFEDDFISRIYGRTEWEGLTFIATQWLCFLAIPIIPLGSYRLRLNDDYHILGSNSYDVYSKEKLNIKQVLKTYLIWLIILPLIVLWFASK